MKNPMNIELKLININQQVTAALLTPTLKIPT
ncbi:Uncharacterised protein [Vibrio cholerae]|nr:Uncharacterised protein [Vibrio cholerae]